MGVDVTFRVRYQVSGGTRAEILVGVAAQLEAFCPEDAGAARVDIDASPVIRTGAGETVVWEATVVATWSSGGGAEALMGWHR